MTLTRSAWLAAIEESEEEFTAASGSLECFVGCCEFWWCERAGLEHVRLCDEEEVVFDDAVLVQLILRK